MQGALEKIREAVQWIESKVQEADDKVNSAWQKVKQTISDISNNLTPGQAACINDLVNKGESEVKAINDDVNKFLQVADQLLGEADACNDGAVCLAEVLAKAVKQEGLVTLSLIPEVESATAYITSLGEAALKCLL